MPQRLRRLKEFIKDKKTVVYPNDNIMILFGIVIFGIVVFTLIQTQYDLTHLELGNSTQEEINQFNDVCNSIYGLDNWSIYGADWISFDPKHYPPTYLKNTHLYTCFKNGTIP